MCPSNPSAGGATECSSPAAECMRSARAMSSSKSNRTATLPTASSIGTAPTEDGTPRQLHIEESLRSIDFEDFEPALVRECGRITR